MFAICQQRKVLVYLQKTDLVAFFYSARISAAADAPAAAALAIAAADGFIFFFI